MTWLQKEENVMTLVHLDVQQDMEWKYSLCL